MMLFWDNGNENMSVTCKMPVMPLLDVYGIHICISCQKLFIDPCLWHAYHTSCLKHWCDHTCMVPNGTTVQNMQVIVQCKLKSCGARGITYICNQHSVESEWHDPYMIEVWTIQMQLQYQLGVNLILRFLWPTCGAYMQDTCCVSCLNHVIPLYM